MGMDFNLSKIFRRPRELPLSREAQHAVKSVRGFEEFLQKVSALQQQCDRKAIEAIDALISAFDRHTEVLTKSRGSGGYNALSKSSLSDEDVENGIAAQRARLLQLRNGVYSTFGVSPVQEVK